jgi:hypothetical protein
MITSQLIDAFVDFDDWDPITRQETLLEPTK